MANTKIKPQTLKGFRDFLPEEAIKRQYVIDKLRTVFERYGFEPLETPALEYSSILLGRYGEEADKLIYQFKDRGGRSVALRYDQTVPLARVVAQYKNDLPIPFKCYQIQPVWRADKPQAGRFREFLQCDADIVGTKSLLADAEIIVLAAKSLENLGIKNFQILINDRRSIFDILADAGITQNWKKKFSIIRSLDKLEKIQEKGVKKELIKKGLSREQASNLLKRIQEAQPSKSLNQIRNSLKRFGLSENKIVIAPTLARGLDYYTGMIFEVQINGYSKGSVAGGGRYDTLIGFFTEKYLPAVGFSFGFDRLVEAMEQLKLFPSKKTPAQVLVTAFSPELLEESIKLTSILRSIEVNTDLYPDPEAKLDKQLKYADRKGISYAIIIGPDEVKNKQVTIKNLKTGEQQTLKVEELKKYLKVGS